MTNLRLLFSSPCLCTLVSKTIGFAISLDVYQRGHIIIIYNVKYLISHILSSLLLVLLRVLAPPLKLEMIFANHTTTTILYCIHMRKVNAVVCVT